MTLRLAGIAALLALTACDPAPSASAAPMSASAAVAPPAFSGNQTDALAMAEPGGNSTADTLIKRYQEAVRKLDKTDDWVLLGRAWIRKARETADPGYYLHAKACADRVLERTPGDALAMGLLGQVELNNHKFKDALATADDVLARFEQDLPSLTNKSDALLELGRYDEAVAVTDKMVDLKPSLPSYARASYLSFLHGEADSARQSIRLAIDAGNDPSDPEPRCYALVQAAHLFFHQGDYEGAAAGYDKALAECPEYHYALTGRGRVLLTRGDAKGAVDVLERAAKKSPGLEATWRLADAKLAAGDSEGAEQAYRTLLDRKSEDPRTVAQFLAVKNRDIDLAVKLAKDEMAVRPSIYTEDTLAWALYRKGDYQEAQRLSERALRLKTPDASLEYHAGAILIAAGKPEDGTKLVQAALARSPQFDPTGAPEAKTLLSR
ncbi:MAG: tetratricopeptide repeat protein [Polyangiaceae bacterium]|nr:tetratricopeptide repeat protein [Polyangiaceae bacterium]